MQRTTAPGSVSSLFVDDNSATSTTGTLLKAVDLNNHQEELANAITASGLSLSTAQDQLKKSIVSLATSKLASSSPASSSSILITALVAGTSYTITSVGTGNWTSIGAKDGIVGETFIATGVGTGSTATAIAGTPLMIRDIFGRAKVTDPISAQDIATKNYVDNFVAGFDFKSSVKAATTANITLSGTQTIDGVSLVAGDRVLVKDQTTAPSAANGIYVVGSSAWSRATDADIDSEVTSGLYVFVEQGSVNGSCGWVLTTTGTITLGTTGLTFTQFSAMGQITAGTGLAKTGTALATQTLAIDSTQPHGGTTITASTALVSPIHKPSADGTSAVQITKADGTTALVTVDTTNSLIGIGTAPSSILHLKAGVAAANGSPLKFTTGVNLTSIEAGAVEFDGTSITFTPNTSVGRATIPVTIYTSGAGTSLTATTETTSQNLFPTANDTITLPIGTYDITMVLKSTRGMVSATSAQLRIKFAGAGTAVGTFNGQATGSIVDGGATSQFLFLGVALNADSLVTVASTTVSGVYNVLITGILRISTAGTFIPQYSLSAGLVSASTATAPSSLNYMTIASIATSASAASTGAWT